MPKSNVQDILAAQRAVQQLDKKGRLAILKDLLAQKLDTPTDKQAGKQPVTYTQEGGAA